MSSRGIQNNNPNRRERDLANEIYNSLAMTPADRAADKDLLREKLCMYRFEILEKMGAKGKA